MSRNQKILLIAAGALVVFCVGSCVLLYVGLPRLAERAFSEDPQRAHEIGSEIAQYTVPPGYHEALGMNMLVSRMVALAPDDGEGMIIFLFGANAPESQRQEMEQQIQQAFQQQVQRQTGELQYVGQERVTIRGQPVTLTISESRQGAAVRQALGSFTGQHGYVMLMAAGPIAEWDETLLTNFLNSIQ